MRELRAWILFAFALCVLQLSFLPYFSYRGASANLLLLLVTSFAFLKGARLGVFMGFCAGILQALATGSIFGIDAISFMLVAIFCGKLAGRIFKDQFFVPVASSIPIAIFHYAIWTLFILMLGYDFPIEVNIKYTMPAIIAFQLIFAYPIHQIAFNIDSKNRAAKYPSKRRKRSFSKSGGED